MALAEKLIEIADGFRTSRGTTAKYTLDQMAELAAEPLYFDEVISHAEIPDYVKEEALAVANRVKAVASDGSIIFLAMSDSHHCGAQSVSEATNTNTGNLHAAQAAKILSYVLDMDFVCHLGDLSFGHSTTTSELLHGQIKEMCSYLDESQKNIPTFWTLGNHDTGMYAVDGGTESNLESTDYLFSIFGSRCEGSSYGSLEHGYCYRDFPEKKLRVICLNSSELDSLQGSSANPSMSEDQLLWFANALYDIGKNSDYGVLVLSHYPLDYSNAYRASDVVHAYITGGSITLKNQTVNFSGNNSAKFIANFHGHTHCFKYARLNKVNHAASSASEYGAWRMAIPNSSFYRNNHQQEVDTHGISFKDNQTWDKTIANENDTSFVVNVIDPSREIVYSFTYGVGPDERLISYGGVTYWKINQDMFNATLSSYQINVEDGKSYNTNVLPEEHCYIESVTVMDGSRDITAEVYNNGVVSIPSVTSDITISAKAELDLLCTNQIRESKNADNVTIYNTVGFKSHTDVHKGVEDSGDGGAGVCSTGFIEIKNGDIIRMDNMDFINGTQKHKINFFDANHNWIGSMHGSSPYIMDITLKGIKDADGRFIQFTLNTTHELSLNAKFIRITCANITGISVLTINEEIAYAGDTIKQYTVTNKLTNVTNSNTATKIASGSRYQATLTAYSGYDISNVTVVMGTTDITTSAYSQGSIHIDNVYDNIIITALAVKPVVEDGNLLNEAGFTEHTYLSSGKETSSGDLASYTTGYISAEKGEVLYCKNIGMQDGQDKHRLCFYGTNEDEFEHTVTVKTANEAYTGFVYGSDGNVSEIRLQSSGNNEKTKYIRFCCSYIGSDSIVKKEPIV